MKNRFQQLTLLLSFAALPAMATRDHGSPVILDMTPAVTVTAGKKASLRLKIQESSGVKSVSVHMALEGAAGGGVPYEKEAMSFNAYFSGAPKHLGTNWYEVEIPVSAYAYPGTYDIQEVKTVDESGNESQLFGFFGRSGIPPFNYADPYYRTHGRAETTIPLKTIEVKNSLDKADIEVPQVEDIGMPASFNKHEDIRFRVQVSDAGIAGLNGLNSPWGPDGAICQTWIQNIDVGGTYQLCDAKVTDVGHGWIEISFPSHNMDLGRYQLETLTIFDRAGNYSSAGMGKRGYYVGRGIGDGIPVQRFILK